MTAAVDQRSLSVLAPQRAGRRKDKLPITRTESVSRWLLRLLALAVFGFLLAPIAIVVAESFNGAGYLVFPLDGISTRHYTNFANDPAWVDAAWTSARIAFAAAMLATVMGTMAASALARTAARGRGLVYGLLYSPAVVPIIVMALGYYRFFSDLQWLGEWYAVAIANAVMGTPFVLVAVSAALQHVNHDLENAARSLGASPVKALRFVTFPQITTGILAGAVFAFVSAFDESVIILFIGGRGSITLTSKLWASVRDDMSPTIAVAGTLLIAVCVLLFLLSELLTSLRERKARS